MAQTQREKWNEFYELIIDRLDIEAKCKEWNVEFTGATTSKGWAVCRAMDRDDNKPSCAINIYTGYYSDLGGGPSHPFFRFAVEYGPYSTFQEATEELARELKVLSKKPSSRQGESFYAKIKTKKWSPIPIIGLMKKLKVSPETIRMIGGSIGICNFDDVCVCFPVYDPEDPTKPLAGNVTIAANGGKLELYQGKGRPSTHEKSISRGSGGMMNKFAMRHWAGSEFIWKVEGISDMITLQEHIPEEFREKHLVVTNSDGADAAHTPMKFASMGAGKNIAVVHDHDEPGQFGISAAKDGGATRWVNFLSATANAVCNVTLFPGEEIAKKKGKDLRDWFDAGNTYEDLMELAKKSTWIQKGDSERSLSELKNKSLTPHQELLRRLDLIVLGYVGNSIQMFNCHHVQKFSISDIDKFSYCKQLQYIGDKANELICDPTEDHPPEHMISSSDLRVAIASEAGGKVLTKTNTIGIGIWEAGGRIHAVGAGEWLAVNGGVSVYKTPMIEDKIVDFGAAEEAWYDINRLEPNLDSAKSPQWRSEHLDEMAEVFGRWKNLENDTSHIILACLCIASWGQSVWPWRPWIGIVGESDSGKSSMMEFISQYFGNMVIKVGKATAAGLRSVCRSGSRIFMHDEFEGGQKRTELLDMLMSANRKGGWGSLMSNASQEEVTSEYQLMPWFGATELKEDKQTEKNRWLSLNLGSREGMERFVLPNDPEWFDAMRNKSIAVVLRIWARVIEICDICSTHGTVIYGRKAESYSIIGGVYGAVRGLSDESALEWYVSLLEKNLGTVEEAQDETEQEMLLQAILSSTVMIGAGKKESVANLIQKSKMDLARIDAVDAIEQSGIRHFSFIDISQQSVWQNEPSAMETDYVFISCREDAQVRRTLLRDTKFKYMNIRQVLKRLPGSFAGQCRVAGVGNRGIYVPLHKSQEEIDREAENEAFVSGDLSEL